MDAVQVGGVAPPNHSPQCIGCTVYGDSCEGCHVYDVAQWTEPVTATVIALVPAPEEGPPQALAA